MKATKENRAGQPAGASSAGRFQNRRYTAKLSWWRVIGWLLYRQRYLPPPQRFPIRTAGHAELLASKPAVPRLVWLGHASFMLRYGEHTVLTDPVFSHRASPFKHFGPARSTPVALSVDKLPPVTQVFISHNHYDHLDKASVQACIIALVTPLLGGCRGGCNVGFAVWVSSGCTSLIGGRAHNTTAAFVLILCQHSILVAAACLIETAPYGAAG